MTTALTLRGNAQAAQLEMIGHNRWPKNIFRPD
jgi:hypothetical protein